MTLTKEQKIERVAAAVAKCDPWTNSEAARAAIAEIEKIQAEEAAERERRIEKMSHAIPTGYQYLRGRW